MPKAYSGDLRKRVIEAVAAGTSRREAPELFTLVDGPINGELFLAYVKQCLVPTL